ncbi:MAG TPA: methylenetetrahydrofolate--tRNA-(uracil(54)-C(5))-methyltransferase (FADH(2)-oxidizing) TrmFO [Longimicrobiales bacterium]|nr:methylenetetrahydrofolate--tRNA-(uracil(54)-C(5))-methyltransferase (FADH(2)-oxidizing) TrmFO [Longimicrobiales bacterium]
MSDVLVVGGGLAGCEAAWQLAERGHAVTLVEMRPVRGTPAHQTADLAELVCTNSFKSEDTGNAHGLLKAEMRELDSILLRAADASRVPAGQALAVDRVAFARAMSERMTGHPRITVERAELTSLPDGPAVIATGPLTSDALSRAIGALLGDDGLAFYDSIAPIISHDSIDTGIAFFASRWGKGEGDDYLNCPMSRDVYETFIRELRAADVYQGHDWEQIPYFEGCLPIEVMAERGADTLRFGPMKPVGLRDPRTGSRPWAVVQLRREDMTGQMWNMVGFQTRLRTGEQRRIFRMIPALEHAEFLRMGSIHRNTYLDFPGRLNAYGAAPARPDLLFAGQLTGVEGYTESAASGILAGINLHRVVSGQEPVLPPPTTMLGALMNYLRTAKPGRFQPMNSNFGLLAPLTEHIRDKGARRQHVVQRARDEFAAWLEAEDLALTHSGSAARP